SGTDDSKRECSFRYFWDDEGKLLKEEAYNEWGQPLWRLHYTSPTLAHYADRRGFPIARARPGAPHVEFAWTPAGFAKEVWYLDKARQKRPDQNGIYGLRRQFDTRGLVIRQTNLDRDGQPTAGGGTIATSVSRYDKQGNRVELTRFDVQDRPVRTT